MIAVTRPLVLVTGSTDGIGLETALQMVRRGADVVLDMHCDNDAVMHLYATPQHADSGAQLGRCLRAPLVLLAEESGELAHVKSGEATMHEGSYLVCAPIVAAGGERLGLLVVRSMPFFALNLENLRLVTVLLGYYADGLRQQEIVQPVLSRRPDCPPDFALELMRLHRLRLSANVVSTLVAFTFEQSESGDSVFEQVRRMRRSLDLLWTIDTPARHVIVMLLPLSASHAHSLANLRKTPDEVVAEAARIRTARAGRTLLGAVAAPAVAAVRVDHARQRRHAALRAREFTFARHQAADRRAVQPHALGAAQRSQCASLEADGGRLCIHTACTEQGKKEGVHFHFHVVPFDRLFFGYRGIQGRKRMASGSPLALTSISARIDSPATSGLTATP